MNAKIHIRRTTAPVKTPRITTQSSNGYISPNQHIPFVSQQKNILPIIPFSFDNSKIISMNHSFHLFTDNVTSFLSHNGCIGTYRGQFSQQTTELERLFNSFYQAILKYSSQQNYKTNPSIRSTGTSFLKSWQAFALSIIELKRLGPGMITQSINAHFNCINTSLKTVMNNGTSKSNVHDQSYKNGRILQNQLNILKVSTNSFLEGSNNSDELKRLSGDMKEFSRLMNDTFSREFTQCGIAQNEVVRLRSKCYTACCDVIHGLKNSYLFQNNLNKLLQLLVSFQESLKDLLIKLNLPLSYLVLVDLESSSLSDNQNVDNDEEEEEERETLISFDENLSLSEFIRDSQKKSNSFIRNQQNGDKFFEILNNKVNDIMSELSKRKAIETDNQKAIKDEYERLKRENKLLMQERKVFMDEADDLKIECDKLNQSINQMKTDAKNTENQLLNRIEKFANTLKQISKIKQEVDDDELITKSLSTHNEALENLNKMNEIEQKLKGILKSDDIISETEKILNQLTQINNKINNDNDSVSQFLAKEQKLKEIFNQFSNLDSPIDVANEISDSFQKLKHIINCTSLSEGVDSIYMLFSDLKESLSRISNHPQNNENDKNSKNLMVLVNNIENEINSAQRIMSEVINDDSSTKTIVQTAETISKLVIRYSNNYDKILSLFEQGQIDSKKEIDGRAVECTQKVRSMVDNFIQKLKQIAGVSINTRIHQNEVIQSLLNIVENRTNQDKETISELHKLCLEVENTLTTYINSNGANNDNSALKPFSPDISKSIRALLKKLPQRESTKRHHHEKEREKSKEDEDETKLFLKNVENKLCQILNEKYSAENDNYQDSIFDLIDAIEERMKNNDEFVSSLRKKLNLSGGTYNEILAHISSSKTKTEKAGNKEDFDKMFEPIFELVPVTSRSEPSQYVPEFCNAFISLHNSVLSMKPFASILNQIFSQFDCKFISFKPSSQSFQFIKAQIYNLHTALNNLAPSKVNSLVFLILSRFVALTSSFTAAIAAASFDDGDQSMKEEFFQMQQELCKSKNA